MMQLSTHLRCTAASGAQALHLVGAVPTCGNLPSRKRNKDGAKKLALTADAKQALPRRAGRGTRVSYSEYFHRNNF